MIRIIRIIQIIGISIRRQFLDCLSWRGFLFTLVLNQAIGPLIGLTVWSSVLPAQKWLMSYYVALLLVQLLTASYENHTLSNSIYAGNLAQDLLQPKPLIASLVGTNIAFRLWHLLFGLPFILISAALSGITLNPMVILLALPALLLAAAMRFLFTYLMALSALWIQQAHSIVSFGEIILFLLGGSAAPLFFFPAGLRSIGEVLPFYGMLGFPAEIACGQLALTQILLGYTMQLFWLLLLTMGATFTWKMGIRRYTAIGG